MFANTITFDVASGQPRVLKRVNQDKYGSEYRYSDTLEQVICKFRHSTEKPKSGLSYQRHNVIVERTVFPTLTALQQFQSVSTTLRHYELTGPAGIAGVAKGILTLLNSGTYLLDVSGGDN